MDLPYTWSDDSNGVQNAAWNSPYVSSRYYSTNSLSLNTPNLYEESDINGDSCKNFKLSWAEPPVEIHEECTTDIDLPPLVWHGYDIPPKFLTVCNTGRTITVNGQWTNGKPYIEGGPLNGKYIFSQIHFHCPSEHEIDGRRYPLEMHVVHYKNSYLTQERAMHEKDGTLVLVYLFQVVESEGTVLSEITKMGNCLINANSRIEMNKIPLCTLVKPFFCNYYVYWGSVMMKKNSYILQWIINCSQSQVTKQEVDTLLSVMSSCVVASNKGPKMKPHNSIIYRVGENYDIHGPCKTVTTETNTSMHFDIVIEAEPGLESNQQTLCLHTSSHPHCNNCATHSVSCSTQAVPARCSTHETRCSHGPAEAVMLGMQSQDATQSQAQNVCGICGGLELEITIPKHVCKCKEKLPKVCSSCGGSKSGISWCKRKWKQCTSKCSLWSKTSSCSNTDTSCKKCSKKRKPRKKKYCSKKSSDTSCSEKHSEVDVCPQMKRSQPSCTAVKPEAESCSPPASEPKVTIKECQTPPENPCEKPCDEPCEQPCEVPCKDPCTKSHSNACSSTSCSTPCASTSDVCTKKKKKKPKQVTKKTSVTSVKKVEKTKTEKTDVNDKTSKKSVTKKESKSSSQKKSSESKDSSKTGKKGKSGSKSKDKMETTEKCSEKEDKKKKSIKKKKKEEEECDEITTLFVKMPENLFPPCVKSSLSCSEVGLNEKKDIDSEDPKCAIVQKEQEYIVNTLTTSGLKIPDYKMSSTSKELYLQMKHSFQSGKSHSTSVSQEFQVSIVCDSNILQEYKGLFQPQEISLGSFEKLQLIPKYQEPDDLTVRLQECVIKKPSLDKFCIDSKFLLKGLNTQNVSPDMRPRELRNFNEKTLKIFDAQTQYSTEKIKLLGAPPPNWNCQSVQTDETYVPMTDKIKRIVCKKLDLKSQKVQTEPQDDDQKKKNTKDMIKCKTRILKTTSEPEFLTSSRRFRHNQYINLMEAKLCKSANANSNKLTEKLECKIKLIKNPQSSSSENTEVGSSSKILQKKDVDKNDLEVAQRNTVYFMYDRIEKDPLTGKKIFMGRFRTKDDLKILKEHKITSKTDSLKSFGSRSTTEKCSSTSSRILNVEKLNDFPENKDLSVEGQKLPPQEAKEEVNAHKFEPKCLDLTQFKAQNSNLIPDVVKWFQEDGENFDLLAEIIGYDKKIKAKIFGQPQTSETMHESVYSAECKTQNGNSGLGYQDKATMYSCHSLTSQSRENSVALRSLDSDAVIIVPVEVESWSKIEVVLIERSDDQEVVKRSKKYIPLLE